MIYTFVPSLQHEKERPKTYFTPKFTLHKGVDSDTDNDKFYFVSLLFVAPVGYVWERFT